MVQSGKYVSVILPIKFGEEVLYHVPEELSAAVSQVGTRVEVPFGRRNLTGVVCGVRIISDNGSDQVPEVVSGRRIWYKDIIGVSSLPPVDVRQIRFWERLAEYYMCTVGEVYKAAEPPGLDKELTARSRLTPQKFFADLCSGGEEVQPVPKLTDYQQEAMESIRKVFFASADHAGAVSGLRHKGTKPLLFHGVTGSGKTEIYISLALEALAQGRSVLYMVPEIALSQQLEMRLKRVFGRRLLLYHSMQTPAQRRFVYRTLSAPDSLENPLIVVGTRSSLFLPFSSLGLVIVDEEHDSSYKQTEPAPRYHARDAAVMLASIYGANIIMGSATPSFESLYNTGIGRYAKVELACRYYGSTNPDIEIVDTAMARRFGEMKGSFSQKLINELAKNLQEGGTSLIFRNRRSYSPIVQCCNCGDIPKCPHCNVSLSYHRYNNTLRCHYCDYSAPYLERCSKCGCELQPHGSGTERVEEELKSLFPDARIERFDADVAASKREQERIIKEFAEGRINMVVGTQMLSKGFDFERLSLVAILQADAILGMQDFRADERALQLFVQLMGRSGRRERRGHILIQSNQKHHPLFAMLKSSGASFPGEQVALPDCNRLMEERRLFNFPPFVRLVRIIVRDADQQRLDEICSAVAALKYPAFEVTGPFVPDMAKVRDKWQKIFFVKFSRDAHLIENKRILKRMLDGLKMRDSIILDVDPI